MLTRKDLEKFKFLGFNLGQIEKDYLQHLCLFFLSKYVSNELVFKGGTALQKCYGLNRFSEDLDFTMNKKVDVEKLLDKVKENFKVFGFPTQLKPLKSKISKNYKFKIKGPLYDGTEKTISSLRIEISLRNDLILEPEVKEIIPTYEDIQPYSIVVMNINEILAEKVRSIMQREKARDVYDLWFLLNKRVRPDVKLIRKKLQLFNLNFSKKRFFSKIKNIKKVWERELKLYVPSLPDFSKVEKEIRKMFVG